MTERIGPYRLLQEIGRGGMGIVYRGERDDELRHAVAIKMLPALADERTRWRLAEERRILASLEHPSIVQMIDSGTTGEGIPYLVMELVDGVPIDRDCADRARPLRARLELFARVCDAVAHAHRRLVVHGDLKPSNILVTADGRPVVLDFGLATILNNRPQPAGGTALLTAAYASPEQLRGEPITAAVDVYSLGLILRELTSGLDRQRDLDTIVMTALHEDPADRYRSVEQLSDDVRRFLGARPISARPATWRYLTSRFVARHRAATLVAASGVILIVSFVAAIVWLSAVARAERDRSERVTSMLIQVFSGSDPRTPSGNALSARELLDLGAAGIRRSADFQPDLGADTRQPSATADSLPAAAALERMARTLSAQGRHGLAEPLARQAFEMTRRLVGMQDPGTAQRLNTLSSIIYAAGRRDEAERLFVQAAEIFRDGLGPGHPMVAVAVQNLAISRVDKGDVQGAERLFREALGIHRRILAEAQWANTSILADDAERNGHPEEAARLLEGTLDALRAARHPALDQVLARIQKLQAR